MRIRPIPGVRLVVAAVCCLTVWHPSPGEAQGVEPRVKDAYFRAVAEHFGLPLREIAIVGDWDLEPDEVPVVLFLSRQAGVSSDVLVGVRRGGSAWIDIATRFGLDARAFYIDLPEGAPLGVLDGAYRQFRELAPKDWGRVRLEDGAVVALVNMRVISERTGASPLDALRAREAAGTFAGAFAKLRGGGG